MIGGFTWRIGAFILAGLLALVGGAGLYDGIAKRAEIRTLTDVLDKTSKQSAVTAQSLGICQQNYRGIELALDRQRADIRDLSEKSATATAEAARRLAEIATATKAAREASQRVLARPLPTPDNACTEAAKLLRGAM